MKYIVIMFFLIIVLVSCGKKGDPVYKDSKILIQTTMNG
tara:strand:- start:12 stop:128 length:117 start_codon:yes stop_codon:yes gene_type:complete